MGEQFDMPPEMRVAVVYWTCLTAVWKNPGSNLTVCSCVYHDSHCDIGLTALGTGCAPLPVPRLIQPPILRI